MRIQKLTGQKNAVLSATVAVGGDASLPFEVSDGWGEYNITFTREADTDDITVSNIGIYSTTAGEPSSVTLPTVHNAAGGDSAFDLLGRPVGVGSARYGLRVKNGKIILRRPL